MSGMEIPDRVDKVAERTAKLAMEHGKSAAYKAVEFLTPHVASGVINTDIADAIVEAEKETAKNKFTHERNAGLHNDKFSVSQGLTAIISQSAMERILQQLYKQGRQPDLYSPQFDWVNDEPESESGIYRMTLPQGVFVESHVHGIRFFTDVKFANETDFMPHEGDAGLSVGDISVYRIEGAEGELWQNHLRNPDGTPRQ